MQCHSPGHDSDEDSIYIVTAGIVLGMGGGGGGQWAQVTTGVMGGDRLPPWEIGR